MAYCSCPEDKRSWFGICNIVIVQPETEEEMQWVLKAQHYAGLVICDACLKVAAWRGEPVGQMTLTGLAHIMKHTHGKDQKSKNEEIRTDLMALCKKHNIYIGADEDDPYIVVASQEESGQTLFKFVFVNPNKIDLESGR